MGDILYQPEPRKKMNGTNTHDDRGSNSPVEITNVTGKIFDEPAEFERRRKLVEEAKKHLLSVQKV